MNRENLDYPVAAHHYEMLHWKTLLIKHRRSADAAVLRQRGRVQPLECATAHSAGEGRLKHRARGGVHLIMLQHNRRRREIDDPPWVAAHSANNKRGLCLLLFSKDGNGWQSIVGKRNVPENEFAEIRGGIHSLGLRLASNV